MSRVQLIAPASTDGERKQLLDQIHGALGATPAMFRAVANPPAAQRAEMSQKRTTTHTGHLFPHRNCYSTFPPLLSTRALMNSLASMDRSCIGIENRPPGWKNIQTS